MRIVVACGAVKSRKMEHRSFAIRQRLMALTASGCNVPSGKREAGSLMVSNGEFRIEESVTAVALFATVPPWLSGKLAFVHVFMAINAKREFDLEARQLAGRNVARPAFHIGVRTHQRKAGLGMCGNRKS